VNIDSKSFDKLLSLVTSKPAKADSAQKKKIIVQEPS